MMVCSVKQLMASLLLAMLIARIAVGEPLQKSDHSSRPRLKSSTDESVLAVKDSQVVPYRTKAIDDLTWQVWVGPYKTKSECHQELKKELSRLTREWINQHVGHQDASRFVHFTTDDVSSRWMSNGFEFQPYHHPVYEQMWHLGTELKFDQSFQAMVNERWRETQMTHRLAQTGFVAGAVVVFVGIMFSYLKLETISQGSRRRWLQLLTSVVILIMICIGVGVFRGFPWI